MDFPLVQDAEQPRDTVRVEYAPPPECRTPTFERVCRCRPAPGAPSRPGAGVGLGIVRCTGGHRRGRATIDTTPGDRKAVRLTLTVHGGPSVPRCLGASRTDATGRVAVDLGVDRRRTPRWI